MKYILAVTILFLLTITAFARNAEDTVTTIDNNKLDVNGIKHSEIVSIKTVGNVHILVGADNSPDIESVGKTNEGDITDSVVVNDADGNSNPSGDEIAVHAPIIDTHADSGANTEYIKEEFTSCKETVGTLKNHLHSLVLELSNLQIHFSMLETRQSLVLFTLYAIYFQKKKNLLMKE